MTNKNLTYLFEFTKEGIHYKFTSECIREATKIIYLLSGQPLDGEFSENKIYDLVVDIFEYDGGNSTLEYLFKSLSNFISISIKIEPILTEKATFGLILEKCINSRSYNVKLECCIFLLNLIEKFKSHDANKFTLHNSSSVEGKTEFFYKDDEICRQIFFVISDFLVYDLNATELLTSGIQFLSEILEFEQQMYGNEDRDEEIYLKLLKETRLDEQLEAIAEGNPALFTQIDEIMGKCSLGNRTDIDCNFTYDPIAQEIVPI